MEVQWQCLVQLGCECCWGRNFEDVGWPVLFCLSVWFLRQEIQEDKHASKLVQGTVKGVYESCIMGVPSYLRYTRPCQISYLSSWVPPGLSGGVFRCEKTVLSDAVKWLGFINVIFLQSITLPCRAIQEMPRMSMYARYSRVTRKRDVLFSVSNSNSMEWQGEFLAL